MKDFLKNSPKFLFFTGKGGVGKTSMSCCSALGLANMGRKVLLISTDPASNLDEVFAQSLGSSPMPISGVSGLFAMNINPLHAAAEYRERMVAPYRGVLPEVAIEQMEEQLSGACTVEIAGFNEFSKFIGDEKISSEYDHIILDTAPTGHTLRLLNLPAAWNNFIAENSSGSSCLGPVSGLLEQKGMFENVVHSLCDQQQTLLVLVSRAEEMSLLEAARASEELKHIGIENQFLMLNGVFHSLSKDPIAQQFSLQSQKALQQMPSLLSNMPRLQIDFRASGVIGIESMLQVIHSQTEAVVENPCKCLAEQRISHSNIQQWDNFIDGLENNPNGVIMTMGKGGVGKTSMAVAIANELTQRGHSVLLSTTDPAAHLEYAVEGSNDLLTLDRIDPKKEYRQYVESVLNSNREQLDKDAFQLLEEEMKSPCIEEIAVFQAFARTVDKGSNQFIVLDTAPTGHTLLLLDSTQAYHNEISKSGAELSAEVVQLLPRIRDPEYTRMIVVTLAEATPVHEAMSLQEDLQRAGIEPYGWIINRSFAFANTQDPLLCHKGLNELPYIQKASEQANNNAVVCPWNPPQTPYEQ